MAVTTSDIEDRLGRSLSVAEVIQVESYIDDAYGLAEAHEWLSSPETAAQTAVIKRVVLRAFRNPSGVTQQTAGPFSVSYGSTARPEVYFSAEDVADMRGVRSGVYSLRLTTPADHV